MKELELYELLVELGEPYELNMAAVLVVVVFVGVADDVLYGQGWPGILGGYVCGCFLWWSWG